MKYLLPCDRCGEKSAVDASQAGRQVICRCGAALQVPSFRAVRELEPLDEPPVKRRRSWNPLRGSLFAVGLVLLALGLVAAVGGGISWALIDTTKPPPEDLRPVKEVIDSLGPADSWDLWEDMRDKGLGPYFVPRHVIAAQGARNMGWLSMIGLAVIFVGLLLTAGALRIGKGRKRG